MSWQQRSLWTKGPWSIASNTDRAGKIYWSLRKDGQLHVTIQNGVLQPKTFKNLAYAKRYCDKQMRAEGWT